MIGESEGKYKGIVKWESVEIAHLVLIRLSVFYVYTYINYWNTQLSSEAQ